MVLPTFVSPPPSPETLQAEGSLKCVLLVDDDRLWLAALSRALAREGFRVLTATSAMGALKTLGETSVDLIISDLRMPRVDGLELRDSLPGSSRAIPFIFLTGHREESDWQAARSLGVEHLLEKTGPLEAVTKLARQLA